MRHSMIEVAIEGEWEGNRGEAEMKEKGEEGERGEEGMGRGGNGRRKEAP